MGDGEQEMAQVNRSGSRKLLAVAVGLFLATASTASIAQERGLDQQAREAAWAGRVGEGLALMDRYLAANPDDRAARLDRARFLAWRGDYARAIETLDALGPDTPEARALRGRIYAWAGFRETALELNAPLYAATPEDYDTAFTQALASRLGESPQDALAPLAAVEVAKPGTRDTRDLARSVRLPMFSSVGVPASFYRDSDDIEIRSLGVDARLRLSDQWTLLAEAGRREHSAPAGGPFAPIGGGSGIDEQRTLVGARYVVSPRSAVEAMVGRSELDPGDGELVGHADWSHRASDAFAVRVRGQRDRVINSPRSVSLDILREGARVDTEWRPSLRDVARGSIGAYRLTDGNDQLTADADYRRAVYRSERANVDIGAQAEWTSYSRDPGNGYYSPDRYIRLAPLVSAYIKLGDDAGLYLQGVVGIQRDDSFDSWKRASDATVEFTWGIFDKWQLAARAGYSERLNEFGRYEGVNAGLALRYRFCEFRADRCPRPD